MRSYPRRPRRTCRSRATDPCAGRRGSARGRRVGCHGFESRPRCREGRRRAGRRDGGLVGVGGRRARDVACRCAGRHRRGRRDRRQRGQPCEPVRSGRVVERRSAARTRRSRSTASARASRRGRAGSRTRRGARPTRRGRRCRRRQGCAARPRGRGTVRRLAPDDVEVHVDPGRLAGLPAHVPGDVDVHARRVRGGVVRVGEVAARRHERDVSMLGGERATRARAAPPGGLPEPVAPASLPR